MVVKLVTDSSSDIPPDIASELDITVVPLYVRFGDEIYRDGPDISADDFYSRLTRDRTRAETSTPSPGDYTNTYNKLAATADGIVSVHLSPRYSSALNAATLAKGYVTGKCEIEVIDSESVSMGCGLVVIAGARAARAGASMEQVTGTVRETLSRTHIAGMISDINYLLGGRRLALPGSHILLGKLGTIFRLKLVGEIYEAGRVWGRGMYFNEEKALARLERCVTDLPEVEEIAVMHAMQPEWAHAIAERLGRAFPSANTYVSRLSGATGVHGGPKAVAIAFTTGKLKPLT
jgi:DegV family protein with EDD domain